MMVTLESFAARLAIATVGENCHIGISCTVVLEILICGAKILRFSLF